MKQHWKLKEATDTLIFSTNAMCLRALLSYRYLYLNRSSKRGGGVAFFVKADMNCEKLPEYSGTFYNDEVLTLRLSNLMFQLYAARLRESPVTF